MARPLSSDVHISKPLNNILVAYMQSDEDYVADKVFPIVSVPNKTNEFFVFDKGDFFRDEAELRKPGTESGGSGYNLSTDTYVTKKYAFHTPINPETEDEADAPLKPREDATRFVGKKLQIKKEAEFLDNFFTTGIWNVDHQGVASGASDDEVIKWSDYSNSDPIKDITAAARNIHRNTGYQPNILVLGAAVYDELLQHETFMERIKYSQKGVINKDLLAQIFDVEKVVVANGIINKAAKGATDDMDYMADENSALLAYAAPNPGLYTPSAGYIFANKNFGRGASSIGTRVYTIPTDLLGLGSLRLEGEMEFDMKLVSAELGEFFYDLV